MSSRELLVLAKHMNPLGAFKRAGRLGHYTFDELVKASMANELMAMRYHQIGGGEPVFFRSEGDIRAEQDELDDVDDEESRDEVFDQLGLEGIPWLED